MVKQRILTPGLGDILTCLIAAQRRGERIVSVSPHYPTMMPWNSGKPQGYIVIVDETEESQRLELEHA